MTVDVSHFNNVTVNGNFNAGTVHGDMVSQSGSSNRRRAPDGDGPAIFISHSHADEELVTGVVKLLLAAYPTLPNEQIRASSDPSLSMPTGARLDEGLLREVGNADVVVGVLSPRALASTYVLAELTAALQADKLLAGYVGITPEASGMFGNMVQRSLVKEAEVRKLVIDLGRRLRLEPLAPERWFEFLVDVTEVGRSYRVATPPSTSQSGC